jgi:ketosteroid isomerase-like protein
MIPITAFRLIALTALFAWSCPLRAHEPTAVTTAATVLPLSVRAAALTVDAFHAALRHGDKAATLALLAPDALIFETGRAERSKAEYATSHLAADIAFTKSTSTVVTRRSGGSSGPIAWVASEGRTSINRDGKMIEHATTETMILRRTASGWTIVHIHWSADHQ